LLLSDIILNGVVRDEPGFEIVQLLILKNSLKIKTSVVVNSLLVQG